MDIMDSDTTTPVPYKALNSIIDVDEATFSLASIPLSTSISAKNSNTNAADLKVPVAPWRHSLNGLDICASMPPSSTDTNAFIICNLLSPAECAYIIAKSEPHLKTLDAQYAQKDRKAERTMFRAKTMTKELFRRLRPFLLEEDYKNRTPLCFGHDGVWKPFGLNECLKIFKYKTNGAFVEHRDGPWVPREDQCSMYTLVIYLNDEFKGGETALIGSGKKSNQSPVGRTVRRYGSQGKGKLVIPTTGNALIFNHDCWHAAEPVTEGTKWILRTEIIFQRIHSFYVDKLAFASDDGYVAAKALYHESMRAMEEGRREDFFEMYAKVVGHQKEAMLTVDRSKQPQLLMRLDTDTFAHVLSYLRESEIKFSLLTVNRKSFAAVVTSTYWEEKWASLLKSTSTLRETRRLEAGAFEHYKSLRTQCSTEGLSLSGGDYFTLYRQQLHMQKEFIPAALILTDPGATFVYRTLTPLDSHKFEQAFRVGFPKKQKIDNYEAVTTHPWYGDWKYSYPLHMNAPSSERFTTGETDTQSDFVRKGRIIDPFDGQPEWSVLSVPIDTVVDPQQVPLLIVPHPAWTEENEESKAIEAVEAAFGVMRVPAVAMCHPAVCLMASSYNLSDETNEALADTTTAVVIVSEQGVHSFMISNETLAILRQRHFVATKKLAPQPQPQLYNSLPQDEPLILLPSEKEMIAALDQQLFEIFDQNDRVLIGVADIARRTNVCNLAKEHIERTKAPTSKVKIVSINYSLVYGAIKLLQCPSFRQKCLFRY